MKLVYRFSVEKRINVPITESMIAFEKRGMNNLGIPIGSGNELYSLNSLRYVAIYITEFNALLNAVYGSNF